MAAAANLAAVESGAWVRIVRLPAGMAAMTRLREMGVVPGAKVQMVRRAPAGDPLEISIRGSLLSLRRSEAALIEVEPA